MNATEAHGSSCQGRGPRGSLKGARAISPSMSRRGPSPPHFASRSSAMGSMPGRYRHRAAPMAALVLVGIVYAMGRPPGLSDVEADAMAGRFRFERRHLPELPGASYDRMVRDVHPSLRHIRSWISFVGAAVGAGGPRRRRPAQRRRPRGPPDRPGRDRPRAGDRGTVRGVLPRPVPTAVRPFDHGADGQPRRRFQRGRPCGCPGVLLGTFADPLPATVQAVSPGSAGASSPSSWSILNRAGSRAPSGRRTSTATGTSTSTSATTAATAVGSSTPQRRGSSR